MEEMVTMTMQMMPPVGAGIHEALLSLVVLAWSHARLATIRSQAQPPTPAPRKSGFRTGYQKLFPTRLGVVLT